MSALKLHLLSSDKMFHMHVGNSTTSLLKIQLSLYEDGQKGVV
jgi:hypothetical protein